MVYVCGNQREKAREKSLKKQKELEKKKVSSAKDGNKGMSLEERRARDAEIMRQKQEKKLAEASGGSQEGATGGASK
ncbi:putative SERF-like protein isoform X1 [Biomphalaria glabrata]|uniref:SERF-like protein isoform X1 n=1 Tax=Biomphalaria glabrata TaxID=6526 RepID=A0A9W3A287_BIOGL|nr:putative SERF-like protein isoform X1 [Biomphalaria glabrata]